eukprot:12071378-Alexandrium_andersonii.AAC.1
MFIAHACPPGSAGAPARSARPPGVRGPGAPPSAGNGVALLARASSVSRPVGRAIDAGLVAQAGGAQHCRARVLFRYGSSAFRDVFRPGRF